MRHSANLKQEDDFQEHSVGRLWVVWLHGPWKNRHVGAYENPLCWSVWILCTWTKLPTYPSMD
jgi:hypothetical protein